MKNLIILLFSLFMLQANAETRIKVVVVDTGVSQNQEHKPYMCKVGHKNFLPKIYEQDIYDRQGHGTNIISIIAESINPKTHCILSFKVHTPNISPADSISAMIQGITQILYEDGVKFVNISMGGENFSTYEKLVIETILRKGIELSVAAGNQSRELSTSLCNYFPACYKKFLNYSNFHVVKSRAPQTNYGSIITDEFSGIAMGTPSMTGSSQATAQKTASLLQKYGISK